MDLVEIKIHQTATDNRHPWETARLDFFIEKMSQFIDFHTPITIMDVGCGDAYFIAQIKRKFPNINCIGVDINFTDELKATLKHTYSDVNLHLFTTVAAAKEVHTKIDLILLMDVIEHIEDDIAFLKSEIVPISQTQQPYIFITVPAYQQLFTNHDVFLGHYRRYNNALLKQNILLAQLKYIEMGYFFTSLIGLRVVEKIMDTIKPKRNATGIANWQGGPLLTSVVYRTLKLDYKFSQALSKFGIKLPGLSNYAICK